MDENLVKSLDALIDEVFAQGEPVVKAEMIKEQKPAKETADEVMKQVPKAEKDEARDAGRPKQISDVPQTDTDGARSGEYDGKIASEQSDAKKKEDSQVKPAEIMKSFSDSDAAELAAFRAEKVAKNEAETLQKAKKEQNDLIKSAIAEAVAAVTTPLKAENEQLRKSLEETTGLVKAMANKPQASKAITNVQHVEKFEKSASNKLSKAEVLDIAEELVKSKAIPMEAVIELEDTGYIYDAEVRGVLDREVARRNRR